MNNLIEELVVEFLTYSYPIIRIRTPNSGSNHTNQNSGLKTKGNFKRTIRINSDKIFKMSDTYDQHRALYALSDIVCRVFNISHDESLALVKLHLHIK